MGGGELRAKKIGERGRWGRYLAFGTGGLSAAVALLMVLAPATAAAAVHPTVVMAPPYLGTASSPSSSISTSGCAAAAAKALHWNSTSGLITGSTSSAAKSCKATTGPVGSSSYGFSDAGVAVGIPFKVATTGNHSIMASITTNMASTMKQTSGGCPKSTVAYPPAPNSFVSGGCFSSSNVEFEFYAYVVDLNNNSWFSNFSDQFNFTNNFWENYTACDNFGTPSCFNSTGWSNFSFGFGSNARGSISLNGAGSLSMWTNGTNMVRGHHYVLVFNVFIDSGASVSWYNVAKHWTASASSSLKMSGTGLGATLGSITVT